MRTVPVVVVMFLVSLSAAADAQLPPRDTTTRAAPVAGIGRIRGRVVAAPANTPLRRVQMVLQWSGDDSFRRVTLTDAQGRYEFTELPVGRFSLSAGTPGYVGLQYGQRRPNESGTPIQIREGETASSIDFALPRGSVIAGRITDELGQPLVQAQVQARRFRYNESGRRTLVPVNPIVATDDRGEFRLFGLMPGEYLVQASVRQAVSQPGASTNPNQPMEGFQPTFFPSTPNAAEAQPITLGIAQETNIQIALTATRLVRVTGTVRDAQDRPAFPAQVTLWTRMTDFSAPFSVGEGGNTSVTTTTDGSFSFSGVVPGEYSLEVRNRVPGGIGPSPPSEAGFLAVTVRGDDLSGLRLTTSRGSTVSGRVVWEGSSPRTGIGQVPIQLRASAQSADSLFPGTIQLSPNLDESGDFQIGGVYGRAYVGVPLPSNFNWTVKSVTLDGEDITDTPVDASLRSVEGVRITLTDRLSHLSGHVADANGRPVMQYVVVLQPADQKDVRTAARFVRTVRPDTEGRFEIRAVRPGRYFATAIEAIEDGRQFSPEFQKELRRGAKEVTVKEGESLLLDLRLTTGL